VFKLLFLTKIINVDSGIFKLKNILIILLLLLATGLQAQLVEVDTTQVLNPAIQEIIHSPKKAAIYSAILPGLGQAYNKKYWKIPVVYAGFGAIAYFIKWNNSNYQTNKLAYRHLTDTIPTTNAHEELALKYGVDLTDATRRALFKDGLLKQQNYDRRNRDLLVISFALFYGLNIIDASVDAHLFNFDISDDLSLNWQPSMHYMENQNIFSVNCTFNF